MRTFTLPIGGNKYRGREIFMNHEILNAFRCHKSSIVKAPGFDRIGVVEGKVVFDRNTNLPDGEKKMSYVGANSPKMDALWSLFQAI